MITVTGDARSVASSSRRLAALGVTARTQLEEIAAAQDQIVAVGEAGSVSTRDHAVMILAEPLGDVSRSLRTPLALRHTKQHAQLERPPRAARHRGTAGITPAAPQRKPSAQTLSANRQLRRNEEQSLVRELPDAERTHLAAEA